MTYQIVNLTGQLVAREIRDILAVCPEQYQPVLTVPSFSTKANVIRIE